MREARDCESTLSCFIPDEEQAAVCQSGVHNACVGDVAVHCAETTWMHDCGAVGLVCSDDGWGLTCGLEPCDPETYEPNCDGDLLLYCSNHVVGIEDCRWHSRVQTGNVWFFEYGGICGTGEHGRLGCIGDGEPCDDETYMSNCDGDFLVSCKGGYLARFDCRDLSPYLTCSATEDRVDCASDGCDPLHETCEDGVIEFCWGGTEQRIDCRRYGFSGCELGEDELRGRVVGFCVH